MSFEKLESRAEENGAFPVLIGPGREFIWRSIHFPIIPLK